MLFDFVDPKTVLRRLEQIRDKFPDAVALGDSLSNPTTTIIGSALLGFDGTYWRRLRSTTDGKLVLWLE